MSIHPDCVECEVLEVEQSSGALPPHKDGLRSAVEAVIGQAVLAEMESRQMPQARLESNRDNILAGIGGWDDECSYAMALPIWRAYLRLHPEQAVKDAHEQ